MYCLHFPQNMDEIYGKSSNSLISSKEEILEDSFDPTDVGLVVEKEKDFSAPISTSTPQVLDEEDNSSDSDLFMEFMSKPPPLSKVKPDSKSIFDDYSSDDSDDIFANL